VRDLCFSQNCGVVKWFDLVGVARSRRSGSAQVFLQNVTEQDASGSWRVLGDLPEIVDVDRPIGDVESGTTTIEGVDPGVLAKSRGQVFVAPKCSDTNYVSVLMQSLIKV
jgi:hypothetical protein